MRLESEFFRLPLRFDAATLAEEVARFAESDWRPHPMGNRGNSYLPLVSVDGSIDVDAQSGAMKPTVHLERSPSLRQTIAALKTVVGRSRLMRIDGNSEAVAHIDLGYYWSQRVRVHIPIVTFPEVRFECGGKSVHMSAGECWIFDTWRLHNVINDNARQRIHLVVDTVGSPEFWNLVDGAERPFSPNPLPLPVRHIPFFAGEEPGLALETINFPEIMTPWEIQVQLEGLFSELETSNKPDDLVELRRSFVSFLRVWRALWARFGDAPEHQKEFQIATRRFDDLLGRLPVRLLSNGYGIREAVRMFVTVPAVKGRSEEYKSPAIVKGVPPFERPVFIVASPRSGSSLLFETLAKSPDFFTVGGESHGIIESVPELRPAAREFSSNRLTAEDATPEVAAKIRHNFQTQLRDRQGRGPSTELFRMLEKTPKNSLRIPFLKAIFPDAKFIHLRRDPAENIASIMEAWLSQRFVTYAPLPGWDRPNWSLALIPNWQTLVGKSLAEIAAAQWRATNEAILSDLAQIPASDSIRVSYQEFLATPQATIEKLCRFADVSWKDQLGPTLPLAAHTLTPPAPNKWRHHAAAIEPLLPGLEDLVLRLR